MNRIILGEEYSAVSTASGYFHWTVSQKFSFILSEPKMEFSGQEEKAKKMYKKELKMPFDYKMSGTFDVHESDQLPYNKRW
jgi:hypothetical protein